MKKILAIFIVIGCLFVSNATSAQNFLSQRVPTEGNSSLGLRYFRYLPPSGNDLQQSFINGVYDLNATIHLNDGWILGGSIPVIYFGSGDMNESGLGNIELKGAKLFGLEQNSMVTLSIYLPTAPNDSEAPFYGIITNLYELAKYSPDLLTFRVNYAYEVTNVDNLIAGIELGPQVLVPSNSESILFEPETEVIINYNLKLGYKIQDFALFGELGSWTIATEEGGFGDNSIHQFSVGLQLINTPIQPGIFWSNIIDEEFSEGSTLGIKVDYTF
jgi:hypothetical protein